ncbi:MAG TPA: reverse transcriptase family protein [Acidimicrobiales bacterium]|nr:reverse transcriptase family protein [Acidimicrobiales bacterium]
MSRRTPASLAAEAVAGAFLAGPWEPGAMGRRAKRALGDRRRWPTDLAAIVVRAYPDRPADRPRELAAFVAACEPFARAAADPDRPLRVHVWLAAPTAMGARRWPVPAIDDLAALAAWLGVAPRHLDWFADRRSLERTAADEQLRHYHRRWVRKRDGSGRLLEAPKRELKDLQRQVLHGILDRIPAHEAAHGFRPGRSVRTGVAPHRSRAVVVRLDLEAFFASVGTGRVYGIFRLAGYPEPVAHALAGLCTTATPPAVLRAAPEVADAQRDQRRRTLARLRAPHLPQGSPTSPALANLAAHALDRRLAGLADRLGARYTRYADDLVLSGDRRLARGAPAIVGLVEEIARDEGFRLHEAKTRVLTAARRQAVTGLVVNAGANVPRPDYDRLRAALHEAATDGPAAANRAGHPDFRAHLEGRIAWAGAGNPARAARLQRAFDAIEW